MRESSSDPGRPTVLVLASTYPRWADDHEPGFVHELCKRLLPHFHVIALVPDSPGADPDGLLDGVEVVRYRYAPRPLQTLVFNGGIVTNLRRSRWKWALVPGFVLAQWWAARRILRQRRVDAIHAHWLIPQGLIARALRRSHGTPYLVTSHGGDLFGLRGALLTRLKRRVASDASAMTVVSTAMRGEAHRLGLRPPRLDVLPMGVDLTARFSSAGGDPREPDTLLFVGRLVPKKGLPHLLGALPLVARQRPGVRLLIAGFGPEDTALRAQAEQLGIADRVQFLGALPQHALPALYRRAALFVAPFIRDDSGNQEGLPVVLMEAIGCGCPALVGHVPGIEDLLGDAAGRLSLDPRDTEAFASRIIEILRAPEQASLDAADTLRIARERVDWQVIADGYAGSLLDVCRQA